MNNNILTNIKNIQGIEYNFSFKNKLKNGEQ